MIVAIPEAARYSQWVPFEVGVSAQNDMPTATFLQANVTPPVFLMYWPRLTQPKDIRKYIAAHNDVIREFSSNNTYETAEIRHSRTARLYDVLK